MNARWFALAGLCALASGAAAQRTPEPARGADPASIRRTITALEERIGNANLSCDYAFFAMVEAPEFIFTDSRGAVTTRSEDLAGASTCKPRRGSFALDEVRMQFHGDVVVFNARSITTVLRDTLPPVVSRNRFTDVLVRRDSNWVLVAGHASRLP
jgi:hypothetical protein